MTSRGQVATLATRPPPAPAVVRGASFAVRRYGRGARVGRMGSPIMLFALCEGIPRDRGRKERGWRVQRGPGSVMEAAR